MLLGSLPQGVLQLVRPSARNSFTLHTAPGQESCLVLKGGVCVCREKKPLGLAGILEFHGAKELCGVHASGTPKFFELGLC